MEVSSTPIPTQRVICKNNYLISTFAPAASSFFLSSSASAFSIPSLRTLGADSMDIVTISAGLSDEFEIDIDLAEIPETGVTVSWITSEVGTLLAKNN